MSSSWRVITREELDRMLVAGWSELRMAEGSEGMWMGAMRGFWEGEVCWRVEEMAE